MMSNALSSTAAHFSTACVRHPASNFSLSFYVGGCNPTSTSSPSLSRVRTEKRQLPASSKKANGLDESLAFDSWLLNTAAVRGSSAFTYSSLSLSQTQENPMA